MAGDACIDCHGTGTAPFHDERHAVVFDTDQCLACHDQSGNTAIPIADRVHAVHSANSAGDLYNIEGGTSRDWSDITYPQNIATLTSPRCVGCHNSGRHHLQDLAVHDALCRLPCRYVPGFLTICVKMAGPSKGWTGSPEYIERSGPQGPLLSMPAPVVQSMIFSQPANAILLPMHSGQYEWCQYREWQGMRIKRICALIVLLGHFGFLSFWGCLSAPEREVPKCGHPDSDVHRDR